IQNGYIGLCATTGERQIVIDEKFWKRSSELSKELIVFHELGHCVLERNHFDEKSGNGTCS
ncbi:MAG: putative metallopeptidase, partial [Saprospiraceae bacterium]